MNRSGTLPWPGWEIVRRLGGGSYGTVYEIRRERYGIVERAAMKVISFPKDAEEVEDQRRSGFTDESLVQSYDQLMQRFLDEYKLMTKLQGQSCIVDCKDYEPIRQPDGIGWDIFIKMELLTPLKKYLAREITPEQTVKLGLDLCKALSLCHEKDIIHRDIKPDNILVSDSGDFKLGDFGVAKTAERTMAGTRTGTPNFTAPEVYHNEPYGKSVDIYSLGMVLYWMLNRRALPFLPLPPQVPSPDEMQEALLRRMRGEALPRPVDGSRALQDVVLKACAYRPEDRYATPEELRRALKAVYAADTSMADTIPDVQPAAPAAEPSFPDADATMGNNWETGPQAEAQTNPTDFDATDATVGTCGTLPASHAEPEPPASPRRVPQPDPGSAAEAEPDEAPADAYTEAAEQTAEVPGSGAPADAEAAPAPKVQTAGAAARKRKRREIWIIAAAAALLVACIVYCTAGVEFRGDQVRMSGYITAITVGRAERLLSEHDCTVLSVAYDESTINASAMRRLGTLTNLTSLDLGGCDDISDLSPLSNLTNLTSLDLGGCDNISDLSPLSNLTNLTSLDLGGCDDISDLSPLSNLTNLTSLDLGGCDNISDLSPLSNLTNLTSLDLSVCYPISDLSPLSNLTNLTSLDLWWCYNITDTDLTPLSNLTNLTSLDLHGCYNISDLSPLSSLTNLTSLNLAFCDSISDLSPLSNLTNLTSLDLERCDNISDLTPLSNLTNLEYLAIASTDVKSLHGLENARKLLTLSAKGCDLTDTSALEVSGRMSALEY